MVLLPNILHAGQSGDEVEENNEYSLKNETKQTNDNQLKIKIVKKEKL